MHLPFHIHPGLRHLETTPSTCQSCRKFFSGDFTKLELVSGKYLCPACIALAKESLSTQAEAKPRSDAVAQQYYCGACRAYFPEAGARGNGWIELVLYLFALVPGIIYSIWRRSGNMRVCPKCRSSSVISAADGAHVKCPDCSELVLSQARKCKHCGCVLVPQ